MYFIENKFLIKDNIPFIDLRQFDHLHKISIQDLSLANYKCLSNSVVLKGNQIHLRCVSCFPSAGLTDEATRIQFNKRIR